MGEAYEEEIEEKLEARGKSIILFTPEVAAVEPLTYDWALEEVGQANGFLFAEDTLEGWVKGKQEGTSA